MSRLHLFLLALAAAAVIAWLAGGGRPDSARETPVTVEDDYHLEGFEMTVFDRDGRATHRLAGETLRQLGRSHDFELEQPRLSITSDVGDWRISARQGWMNAAMTRARLKGQIDAIGRAEDELRLTTSDLDIDLVGRVATTPALVSISQGDNRLRGEALTANLQTHRLRLQSNIEGYYVP